MNMKICFLVTIAALNLPTWAFGSTFDSARKWTSEKHTAEKVEMTLVDGGKPNATIIIKKQATDLQLIPAKDLQEYVRKITGALLPIYMIKKRPKIVAYDGELQTTSEAVRQYVQEHYTPAGVGCLYILKK